MIVIDTSAVIAILQDEPEAAAIKRCIVTEDRPLVAAPTKFEILMVASRRPDGPSDVLVLLGELRCAIIDWTDRHADIAADAFLRFGKGRHPAALNLGDCMAYAVAKALDAPLLYKGDDFARTDVRSAL